jgi:hypothetical protein
VLEPDEVLVERSVSRAGPSPAEGSDDGRARDDARRRAPARGALNDLIRAIQVLRKDSGLEITDRIRVWIPDEELLVFADQIAAETLAVSVELGDELRLEKA